MTAVPPSRATSTSTSNLKNSPDGWDLNIAMTATHSGGDYEEAGETD